MKLISVLKIVLKKNFKTQLNSKESREENIKKTIWWTFLRNFFLIKNILHLLSSYKTFSNELSVN